jgi:hypothetical protein
MERSDVQQILEDAKAAVEGAAIPDDLRAMAFEKAVDLLSGLGNATIGIAPVVPAAPEGSSTPPPQPPPVGATGDRSLERIAQKLDVGLESVREVFHIDGENLSLSIGRSQLETTKAKGAKQIALLVAAGRQAGGWDAEWTPSSEIRPIADAYGKFDSANFATTVKEMDDVFSFSGDRSSRKVKVRRKGLEEAAALVKSLAGEDAT